MRTGRIFERAAQKSDTCTVGIATSAPPAAIAYTGPMKTKSHGTAFAHPVAPLMWKSGTCHFVMARVAYVARPAATSRYCDAFGAKKSTLTTINQISAPCHGRQA
jgi:hypothetical protein